MSAWSTQAQASGEDLRQQSTYHPRRSSQSSIDHDGPSLQTSLSAERYTPAYARRRSSASTHGVTPPMSYGTSPSQYGTGDYLQPQDAFARHENSAVYEGSYTQTRQQYGAHSHAMPPAAMPPHPSQQLVQRRYSYPSGHQPSYTRRSSHQGISPHSLRVEDTYTVVPTTSSRPYDPQRRSSTASHRSQRSQRSQRSRRSRRGSTPERVSMGDTLMLLFGWTKHLMPARRQ